MPRTIETQPLAPAPETFDLQIQDWRVADGHDDDLTPTDRQPWTATVRVRADRFDITAKAPDGRNREIWIEIDKGDLVAHCYDPDHDEPLSVRIGATSISVIDDCDQRRITPGTHPIGNTPTSTLPAIAVMAAMPDEEETPPP